MRNVFLTAVIGSLIGLAFLAACESGDGSTVTGSSVCNRVAQCFEDEGESNADNIKSECLSEIANASQACLDCLYDVNCNVFFESQGMPAQCMSACSGGESSPDIVTNDTNSNNQNPACTTACQAIVDCFTGMTLSDCVAGCSDAGAAASLDCMDCFSTYDCSECEDFRDCLVDYCDVPDGVLEGC